MKVGDKVVYIGGCNEDMMICPVPKKEVVTVESLCMCGCNGVRLVEYPVAKDGLSQVFVGEHIRKVENKPFKNAVTKELAKTVIENQPETEVEKIKEKCLQN